MKSVNIYKIGLIMMILINGVLISMMFFGRGKGDHKRPMHKGDPMNMRRDHLIKKISADLNFTSEQEKKYVELAKIHREFIRKTDKEHEGTLEAYFFCLKDSETDSLKVSEIVKKLKDLEEKKLTITFHHFEDLKKLCDTDQLIRFETIVDDIVNDLVRGRHRKRKGSDHHKPRN